MVKVTIVGRARDGLPLSQGVRYMNEENAYVSCYRQLAEFILQEISTGGFMASKFIIPVDHCSFMKYWKGHKSLLLNLHLQYGVRHASRYNTHGIMLQEIPRCSWKILNWLVTTP
ncbi:hypothetical protein PIB30_006002 [Stylosanthes scabra]|uniref:Uncharacterized protein n=1 Tax=Stylosanthes scabra TaxID=79078 RepID=A0ABU6T5Y9_9FABA|nr:hypothetical protein [Stylosanthes scabra]